MLVGNQVRLRTLTPADLAETVRIRSHPDVMARWWSDDVAGDAAAAIADESLHYLAIEDSTGTLVGGIQWVAEPDPDYAHASIDIYPDPPVHGRGLCTESVQLLVGHLFAVEGHHRITIDPAADNIAAIRCYEKAGFVPVGIMRQYERGPDGTFHDGLLMECLRGEWRQASG